MTSQFLSGREIGTDPPMFCGKNYPKLFSVKYFISVGQRYDGFGKPRLLNLLPVRRCYVPSKRSLFDGHRTGFWLSMERFTWLYLGRGVGLGIGFFERKRVFQKVDKS